MLLTGEMIEPEDAERWGLVNRMVPEDHLEEVTMALANKFSKKSLCCSLIITHQVGHHIFEAVNGQLEHREYLADRIDGSGIRPFSRHLGI